MYRIQRPSRSRHLPIRRLQYHLREWGEPNPDAAPWVMVHGWMDVSASFQFVVDALTHSPWILAPDWRGFGLTDASAQDCFWFPDYVADLDALLDATVGDQPVNLIGHSMGGHVATLYAGARPERVRKLVNLEGLGMPATRPAQAPGRLATWMDELRAQARGENELKPYNDLAGVAQRLTRTNPRLSPDKALWLASHWASQGSDGLWRILGHAGHKITSATLFRLDEVLCTYERIQAPMLFVQSDTDSLSTWWQGRYSREEFHQRLEKVPQCETITLAECGHMLHHDQPQALAQALEAFLLTPT